MTEMKPVVSSMVKAVGYDAATQTLVIEYNTGGYWQYKDVPADVFGRLWTADSPGQFVTRYIKGIYSASKVSMGMKG